MERTLEHDLVERTLTHVRDRTTDLVAAETRYSARDYYDEDRYRHEIDAVFRRRPTIVAHVSQLARPGDFVTETVCGLPLVLNRTSEGTVNAFLNVCRHRGARLVGEAAGGRLTGFLCPYHAWTYGPDGDLRNVPDEAACFPNLDRSAMGLVRVPVEVRHGFVWVTPSTAGGGLDVDGHLGPMGPELASFGFDDYVFYSRESEPRSCNWKLGVEGFLENYHFAVLHKNSTAPIFVHNVSTVDRLGDHVRGVAPKRSMARFLEAEGGERELRQHATILYVIFPSTCLFVERSHASLLQFLPEGPDRSRVVITHLVSSDSLRLRRLWDENIRLFNSAVVEDLDMCDSVQGGIRSGANRELLFGRNEAGCVLFRETLEEVLARDPVN
jgi:phenylpropionate dioxygenase-like ring-hydroxylating dioxygenase large terminal subunit